MSKTNRTVSRKVLRKAEGPSSAELDSVFFLKLVLYLIIGSQWLRFTDAGGHTVAPVPIGLIVGILFAAHDHFQIDRKIEFAILLVAMFVGFWTQVGVFVRM